MNAMSAQPNRVAVSADRRVELGGRASAAPVAGWWLIFMAGFVPVVAGLVVLAVDWLGVLRADSPFWTGLGNLGFSYSSLDAAGSGAALWAELIGSVGGVNIVAAGVAVSVVARFGLRDGRRWAWWFLFFCLLWIGIHDAVMTTRFFMATDQPFMVLPYTYCVLMFGGLLRSRRVVFAHAASMSG